MSIRKIDTNIGTIPTWGDDDFDENVHENFTSLKTIIPKINNTVNDIDNTVSTMNGYATSASSSASDASESSLLAQASANYQGVWSSKGYTVGQSVKGSDGSLYRCDVTHTTAQNPTTTTGYWSANVAKGSYGVLSQPLLDLDLINNINVKAGKGGVTYSGASTATYIDKYGVLKYVRVDEPRFEKDGLLIECASTNICTHSQGFTDSSYTIINNGTFIQGQPNIDGSTNAVKFVTSTTLETQQFNKNNYYAEINSVITVSAVVEQSGAYKYFLMSSGNFASWETRGTVIFDLTDGVVVSATTEAGTGNITGAITNLGGGRFKCELRGQVRNSDIANSHCYMSVRNVSTTGGFMGDGISGVILHNMQIEALPFATSYIPTTTSAVTRVGIDNKITGYGNTPTKDEGTIYCRFKLLSHYNSFNYIWGLHSTSTNNIRCFVNNYGFLSIRSNSSNGGLVSAATPFTINNNQEYSVCATWKDSLMKVYIDGVLAYQLSWVGDLFDASLPTLADFSIGKFVYGNASLMGNGNYKSFKTYNKALTDTQVKLLSGGN